MIGARTVIQFSNGDYIHDLGQLYTESYVSGKLSNIEQYYFTIRKLLHVTY